MDGIRPKSLGERTPMVLPGGYKANNYLST